MEEEEKKDILFQIDMQLYDEFNDKIATMNDHLGDIYSLRDIEEVEQAEKEEEIHLLREAIKKQQKEIEEFKEKEKNLLKQLKDSEKELLEVTQNVVNKDRIKELIFYINKDIEIRDFKRMHMQHTTTDSYEIVYSARGVKEMLKNLLEE